MVHWLLNHVRGVLFLECVMSVWNTWVETWFWFFLVSRTLYFISGGVWKFCTKFEIVIAIFVGIMVEKGFQHDSDREKDLKWGHNCLCNEESLIEDYGPLSVTLATLPRQIVLSRVVERVEVPMKELHKTMREKQKYGWKGTYSEEGHMSFH